MINNSFVTLSRHCFTERIIRKFCIHVFRCTKRTINETMASYYISLYSISLALKEINFKCQNVRYVCLYSLDSKHLYKLKQCLFDKRHSRTSKSGKCRASHKERSWAPLRVSTTSIRYGVLLKF